MPITECPTCEKGTHEDIELEEHDCREPKCECSECDLRTLGERESLGTSKCECSECDLRTCGETESLGTRRCECSESSQCVPGEAGKFGMSGFEYSESNQDTQRETELFVISVCECSEYNLSTLFEMEQQELSHDGNPHVTEQNDDASQEQSGSGDTYLSCIAS